MARGRRRTASNSLRSEITSPKRSRLHDVDDRLRRDALLGGKDQEGRRPKHLTSHNVAENLTILKAIQLEKDSELKVTSVNFNIESNRTAHHTDEYEQEELIVRRGQTFNLTLTFDRDYNPEKDSIILQFVIGNRPKESKHTILRVPLRTEPIEDVEKWYAVLSSHSGSEVNVEITAAAEGGIVGRYTMFVETVSLGEDENFQHRYEVEEKFVLLFNPWCKGDDVYVDDEEKIKEYVMNEKGRIWWGTARQLEGTPWDFGQFDDVSLEAALHLLNKSELAEGARSNPVLVCRKISAMANSNDAAGGVLTGRWEDEYPKGCTLPWAWTGSVAILEEYMKTKKEVQFGQCWVFSGLVTTLLRTLGIPARSVTTFESAHDKDASTSIDVHWDEDGNPLEDLNDDTIWNFHVWNEAWMRRADLPSGYDGWQALDATPQEVSEGVMQCGPVPVKAIKNGCIYLPYDAPFVFAEVNGDRIHWTVKNDGSLELLSKEKDSVGKKISTKAVGSNQREDLTSSYKHEEGSEEERAAVRLAHRFARRPKEGAFDIPDPDVTFTLVTPEGAILGDDLELAVQLKNTVEEERNVSMRVSALVSYYTGVTAERVAVETIQETLAANEEKTCTVKIPAGDYEPYMKPDTCIQAFLRGTVLETKRSYAHSESFVLHKPPALKLEAPEKVEVGKEFELKISFTNPLDKKLTGSEFHVEGSRIIKPTTIPHRKAIPAHGTVEEVVNLTAKRSGEREVIVTFNSDQIKGVVASLEIYVKYQA